MAQSISTSSESWRRMRINQKIYMIAYRPGSKDLPCNDFGTGSVFGSEAGLTRENSTSAKRIVTLITYSNGAAKLEQVILTMRPY